VVDALQVASRRGVRNTRDKICAAARRGRSRVARLLQTLRNGPLIPDGGVDDLRPQGRKPRDVNGDQPQLPEHAVGIRTAAVPERLPLPVVRAIVGDIGPVHKRGFVPADAAQAEANARGCHRQCHDNKQRDHDDEKSQQRGQHPIAADVQRFMQQHAAALAHGCQGGPVSPLAPARTGPPAHKGANATATPSSADQAASDFRCATSSS
jgi:hypothetical protein